MKRRFTKVMAFIMTMVMLFMVPGVPSLAETTVNVENALTQEADLSEKVYNNDGYSV